jgi:hypothetical protein
MRSKPGIKPISQAKTTDLYKEAGVHKPKAVKKHEEKPGDVVVFKYARSKRQDVAKLLPDGRYMLASAEPLPDPHTKDLKINNIDIVEEMNARWKGYWGWSDEVRDEQVRQDFARYGSMDKRIKFDPKLNKDAPYYTGKPKLPETILEGK